MDEELIADKPPEDLPHLDTSQILVVKETLEDNLQVSKFFNNGTLTDLEEDPIEEEEEITLQLIPRQASIHEALKDFHTSVDNLDALPEPEEQVNRRNSTGNLDFVSLEADGSSKIDPSQETIRMVTIDSIVEIMSDRRNKYLLDPQADLTPSPPSKRKGTQVRKSTRKKGNKSSGVEKKN